MPGIHGGALTTVAKNMVAGVYRAKSKGGWGREHGMAWHGQGKKAHEFLFSKVCDAVVDVSNLLFDSRQNINRVSSLTLWRLLFISCLILTYCGTSVRYSKSCFYQHPRCT
jgi:hypothetical protein